jgi:hypothetical protein
MIAVYKPCDGISIFQRLASKLFYNDYAYRTDRLPFRSTRVQIHDQLTAPVAAFISGNRTLDVAANMKNIQYYWQNKNSWNFAGMK